MPPVAFLCSHPENFVEVTGSAAPAPPRPAPRSHALHPARSAAGQRQHLRRPVHMQQRRLPGEGARGTPLHDNSHCVLPKEPASSSCGQPVQPLQTSPKAHRHLRLHGEEQRVLGRVEGQHTHGAVLGLAAGRAALVATAAAWARHWGSLHLGLSIDAWAHDLKTVSWMEDQGSRAGALLTIPVWTLLVLFPLSIWACIRARSPAVQL